MPDHGQLIDTPVPYRAAPQFVASPSDPEPYVDVDALRAVFAEVLNDWYSSEIGRIAGAGYRGDIVELSVYATRQEYERRSDAWSAAGGGDL